MSRVPVTSFVHGLNYAWSEGGFGNDFGGNVAWGRLGVAAAAPARLAELREMRAAGATVVRWWMFPELVGDGVSVDGAGLPVGLGGTAEADVLAALELAARADVRLMLCLFSFDGFRPDATIGVAPHACRRTGLAGIVRDARKRHALLVNVVEPLARLVARSPHADRLFAWDLINEPEWALKGRAPGAPRFAPLDELEAVSWHEMRDFLGACAEPLRTHGGAITVGSAGLKWTRVWRALEVAFDQPHLYEWGEALFPHDRPLSSFGLGDRPVIVGELSLAGLGARRYPDAVARLRALGYAGAFGWAYRERNGLWARHAAEVRAVSV